MKHQKNNFKQLIKKSWVKWSVIFIASVAVLFFGFYASIYFGVWGKIPSKDDLANLKQSQATQVLDKSGKLIGKYYTHDRQSIHYEDFPQHLIDALIATEDARFYEHDGIDNRSLLRVFFKTILMGNDSSGGGSTITLQLAKNLFGRKDYGYLSIVVNKLRESIVATRIEEIYSKKEIISLYFNTVPFSDNTYGIESASEKFFNKHAYELSLAEAATLVGSLKANHSYNPRLFPERSQLRRDVVLQQMAKYNYISTEQASVTMQEKIELDYQYFAPNQGIARYFRELTRKELKKILQKKAYKKPDGTTYDIYNDGLKVYTTLDYTMQQYAEEAMRQHMADLQKQFEKAYGKNAPWLTDKKLLTKAIKRLDRYKKLKKEGISESQIMDSLAVEKEMEFFEWNKNTPITASTIDSLQHHLKFLNSGMISVEPSGAIRAYVGGIDFRYFKFDHIVQSKRQVGSTFKPIVYTTAIENGMDPCTHFSGKTVTYTDFDNWTPKNASSNTDPELNYSLQNALSNSINTVAVKVLQEAGIDKVIDQAHKMGISSEIKKVPSIALGTAEISLMELAEAYTAYINDSKPATPYFITKIEDKNGNVIANFSSKENQQEKVFSNTTRQIMVEMMKATINSGTAKRLRTQYKLNNALAGKTGTTQNNKDGWFVGLSPKLVSIVWVGHDNHKIGFSSTALGQGANSALPIFGNFMQKMNADTGFNEYTKASFEKPSESVIASLDCEPTEKDGFFKRLFGSKKKKTKKFEKKKKKKKGFFSFLKGKKDE